jgi:hypothetical protein
LRIPRLLYYGVDKLSPILAIAFTRLPLRCGYWRKRDQLLSWDWCWYAPLFLTTLGLAWVNSLQELVPSDQLGRVMSIDALGSFALLPVGYALAGVAADQFGASIVFQVGGILSAIVIALGLLHPSIRAVD